MLTRLDYSKLSLFHNCARAYYYAYIKNIVPKTISDALSVGAFVHAYINKPDSEKEEFLKGYTITPTKEYYTLENIRKTLNEFNQYVRDNNITECLKEVKLTRKICKGVQYVGIIDMLDTNNNIIYEIKTTASYSQNYADSFDYSNQNIGYEWLLQSAKQYLTGKNITHKIIFLDLKAEKKKIKEKVCIYTKLQLEMFENYVVNMVKLLKQLHNDKRNFIPNLHFCKGVFPSWSKCQYLPLCFVDKEYFNSVKKMLFKRREEK